MTVTDNPCIKIYVNKMEIRITFKIKPGFYFYLLTPVMTKLLRSNKSRIIQDKIGENELYL